MEYLAAALVVVFLCVFLYRRGVKDGMAIKNEKPLEPIFQPKPEKLTAEEQKEQETIMNRYKAILDYDPYGDL